MDRSLLTRTPWLGGDDTEAMRATLRRYFHESFDTYERLFEVLAGEEAGR